MEVRDKDLTRISLVKSTSEFVLKYILVVNHFHYVSCSNVLGIIYVVYLQVFRMLLDEKGTEDVLRNFRYFGESRWIYHELMIITSLHSQSI